MEDIDVKNTVLISILLEKLVGVIEETGPFIDQLDTKIEILFTSYKVKLIKILDKNL